MIVDLYDENTCNSADVTVWFNGERIATCIRADTDRGMVWLNPDYLPHPGPFTGEVRLEFLE